MGDSEQFERIPWEHLKEQKRRLPVPPRNLLFGIAGAVAVAMITAALVPGRESAPSEPAPMTTATAVGTSMAVPPSSTATTTPPSMFAIGESELAVQASGWGEWLTASYLTVDGTGAGDWARFLPPGSPVPAPASGERTFVESVHTLEVTETASGEFRVLVRARYLIGLGTDPYQRQTDRVLAWNLRWMPEGWMVLDLPELAEGPSLQAGQPLPIGEIPDHITAAVAPIGVVLGGGPIGENWRLVVGVSDSVGGQWPLIVWFAADGRRLDPATASG